MSQWHKIFYDSLCANEDLVQLAHLYILSRTLCHLSEESLEVWQPIECQTVTDQPAHLGRLIRVLAWRTCNLVENAVP